MSGDPIDLDAIEARANAVDEGPGDYDVRDILALVAEVRRLRASQANSDEWRVWFKDSDMPTAAVDERTARSFLGHAAHRLERRVVGQWETVE